MACSKYISTKETTNAARVSRLLVDPCTDLFRDILRNHVTEIQLPHILRKEQSTLNSILNKVQREIVYPKSVNFNGTYADFDLSLLYILLRNISGIMPHQEGWAKSPNSSDRSLSANIDRIREIRNTYCGHAPSVSLPDVTFHKLWQDITVIIGELEGYLPGGCTQYTDAATMIKSVTMDPVQEKNFLDMIDQQHKTTEDLKGDIMDLKKQQISQSIKEDVFQSECIQQGKRMSAEQLKQKRQLKKLNTDHKKQEIEMKRLKHEQKQQKIEQERVSDSERNNILESTLAVLKAQKLHKVNTRTSGVQTTIDKLRDNNIAVLTGKAGIGKTTVAYQVMSEMSDPSLESRYTPVLLSSPKQCYKIINPTHRYLVFLDDIFGSTNLDAGAVEKWKAQIHVIFSCAKTGKVMMLIGLRRHILDEAKKCFSHAIFDDENVIDLSSKENFTRNDKEKILEAYEDIYQYRASELWGEYFSDYAKENGPDVVYRLSFYKKEEILSANSYYGFPLTCFQYFSTTDFFQLGPSYFKHADEKLFEAIENMRRAKYGHGNEQVKYCILCYVFVNGSIETNSVSETLFKNICEKLRVIGIHEIDVKDAIDELKGLFLSKVTMNPLYKFSHETILEAVMVSFGQIAPDIVINCCSRIKLRELIRTQKYETKPGEVVLKIPRHHYEDLARRLVRGDDGDGQECTDIEWVAENIALHPASKDKEFVSVLCNLKPIVLFFLLKWPFNDFHLDF